MEQKIKDLHAWYVQETGLEIPLDPGRQSWWFQWLQYSKKYTSREWNSQDLLRVLSYYRKSFERSWWPKMMGFRRIIEGPEVFAEDLAQANAYFGRNKRKTPREQVLEQSGRPQENKGEPAKPVGDFLKCDIKEEIRKMREAAK